MEKSEKSENREIETSSVFLLSAEWAGRDVSEKGCHALQGNIADRIWRSPFFNGQVCGINKILTALVEDRSCLCKQSVPFLEKIEMVQVQRGKYSMYLQVRRGELFLIEIGQNGSVKCWHHGYLNFFRKVADFLRESRATKIKSILYTGTTTGERILWIWSA